MDFTKMFALPINAASHGHEVDMIIYLMHIVMFVLLVGWGGFFIFCLFRFRKGKNPKASYTGVKSHASSYLEVGVALIEALILIGFAMPLWAKQVNVLPKRADNVEVRVIAEQFAWNIHYPGADGIFGKTAVEFLDKQSNPLGLDPEDPNGKDDFSTINQLHLPIGRPAIIHLTSKDVVHSFGIPVMRIKQDAIPGLSIPTWFTPTKTSPKGEPFEIVCSQLCGIGHYRMKGFLTVHSEENFQEWLDGQSVSSSDDEEYDDFWN